MLCMASAVSVNCVNIGPEFLLSAGNIKIIHNCTTVTCAHFLPHRLPLTPVNMPYLRIICFCVKRTCLVGPIIMQSTNSRVPGKFRF